MRVAVIGGGPSGLVTLKYLTTAHNFFPDLEPIEANLFEAEELIGGTMRYRSYEDAELVSSRQLTTFSDYRYNASSPDFLSIEDYCTYLEGYCKQFNLWPHINLRTRVTRIQRVEGGGHIIQCTQDGKSTESYFDAVAICTGLNVTPNIPKVDGLERIPALMHSSQFKGRKQFGVDKNVLILGTGETGMDLAYLAITSPTKSVTLCHRDGFLCAPKRAPSPSWFGQKPYTPPQGNVPYDINAASLFDTAYIHPLIRDSFLPWWYYDRFAKWTTWLVSGTKAGLDQWVGEISPANFHTSRIFFNKSTNAMPFIAGQYRKSSWLNTARSWVAQVPIVETGGKKIDLAPWPREVTEKGVVKFTENGREEAERMRDVVCKPDLVILATGYTQSFPFMDSSYPTPIQADTRGIWKTGDQSVGFIGFVRPSFGAIPPLAEMQSQLWVLSLLRMSTSPLMLEPESHYKLLSPPDARVKIGVDYESYAYQLALDVGSAPSFLEVLSLGPKLLASWALSSNVTPKFRLVGPWKWDGAQKVMEGEIWETVSRRRGFFGHVTLSLVPIVLFGSLSAVAWVLCLVARWVKLLWKILTMQPT